MRENTERAAPESGVGPLGIDGPGWSVPGGPCGCGLALAGLGGTWRVWVGLGGGGGDLAGVGGGSGRGGQVGWTGSGWALAGRGWVFAESGWGPGGRSGGAGRRGWRAWLGRSVIHRGR